MTSQTEDRARGPETAPLDEAVFSNLLDRIKSGAYGLGDRLPSENDLAGEFSVSRPIVRAALARLRENGLITSRQGAGSFVSWGEATEPGELGPIQSIDDIAAWYGFRRIVEGEAAALAAGRITAGNVAELADLTQGVTGAEGSHSDTVRADLRFHIRIAEISGNRFLAGTLAMLQPQFRFVGRFVRSMSTRQYLDGKAAQLREHRAILDALARGDGGGARQAMVEHIDCSQRRVFSGEAAGT